MRFFESLEPEKYNIEEKELMEECKKCLTKKPSSDFEVLECGHGFCGQCYKKYLKKAVKRGIKCLHTKCLEEGCSAEVSSILFERLLPKIMLENYRLLLQITHVNKSKDLKWCPTPSCRCIEKYKAKSEFELVCNCGYSWCFCCGGENHRPLSCAIINEWTSKIVSDLTDDWISANTISCPLCLAPIIANLDYKDQSLESLKVICYCGFEFCFVCLLEWDCHNQNPIENQCYQNLLQKEIEFEIKRNTANLELEKLRKYIEQYKEYRKSRDYIKLKHEKAVANIKNINKICKNSNFFYFFTQATQTLINAYTTLGYSCCFIYILTSNPKANLYKIRQTILIDFINKLEKILDFDLLDSIEIDLGGYNRLSSLKMEISYMTQTIEKYLDDFLIQMEQETDISASLKENK